MTVKIEDIISIKINGVPVETTEFDTYDIEKIGAEPTYELAIPNPDSNFFLRMHEDNRRSLSPMYIKVKVIEYDYYLKIKNQLEQVSNALRGILEIGKRDMSNPKYDSYFENAEEVLKK